MPFAENVANAASGFPRVLLLCGGAEELETWDLIYISKWKFQRTLSMQEKQSFPNSCTESEKAKIEHITLTSYIYLNYRYK